jgi:hypothetical protein
MTCTAAFDPKPSVVTVSLRKPNSRIAPIDCGRIPQLRIVIFLSASVRAPELPAYKPVDSACIQRREHQC